MTDQRKRLEEIAKDPYAINKDLHKRIIELEQELKDARAPYVMEQNNEWMRLFGILWYNEEHHKERIAQARAEQREEDKRIISQVTPSKVSLTIPHARYSFAECRGMCMEAIDATANAEGGEG